MCTINGKGCAFCIGKAKYQVKADTCLAVESFKDMVAGCLILVSNELVEKADFATSLKALELCLRVPRRCGPAQHQDGRVMRML